MNIPSPSLSLSNESAILLEQFLKTPAGIELIEVLNAGKPPLVKVGEQINFETRAIRATETQTWEHCIQLIKDLAANRQVATNDPMIIQGEP